MEISDKTRRQAEVIFKGQQALIPQYEAMGIKLTAVMSASVEEIAEHLQLVENIGNEYKVNLDAGKFAFPATEDVVRASADAKLKAKKRSAGARALKSKYGKENAEWIIEKKTGKHISLQ